jgi:hypothetical protein
VKPHTHTHTQMKSCACVCVCVCARARACVQVELLGNAVHGYVWCSHKRPERLVQRHNNFDDAFPHQWNEIVETHRAPPVTHPPFPRPHTSPERGGG